MTTQTLTIASPLSSRTVTANKIIDRVTRTVFSALGHCGIFSSFPELSTYAPRPECTGSARHGNIKIWAHLDNLPPIVMAHLEE